jgi:hypothetical protein
MNGFLAWIPAVSVGYFAARANPDLRADRSCLRRHPPPGRAALSPGQRPLGGKRRPIMYAAMCAINGRPACIRFPGDFLSMPLSPPQARPDTLNLALFYMP